MEGRYSPFKFEFSCRKQACFVLFFLSMNKLHLLGSRHVVKNRMKKSTRRSLIWRFCHPDSRSHFHTRKCHCTAKPHRLCLTDSDCTAALQLQWLWTRCNAVEWLQVVRPNMTMTRLTMLCWTRICSVVHSLNVNNTVKPTEAKPTVYHD